MSPMVFISSRINELEEEREKVMDGINELWNQEDMPFKYWEWNDAKEIPSGKDPDEVQSEGVKNSDIYLLILGSEYGDFEYGESPTHKEYTLACSETEEDRILIYIKKVENREEKVHSWIKEIKENNKHTCRQFENPHELKNLVTRRLRNLQNKGVGDMEVVIKEVTHVPALYRQSSNISGWAEKFDANELNVEIRDYGNSKSFIAFLVSFIFHNRTEHDTTIDDVALTAFTENEETTTIPNRIKLDDDWNDFDSDTFTYRIDKNSSKRVFFRFISKDFLVQPEVSIKLTLNHTFGDFELDDMSKFTKTTDEIKWAKGSSGGRGYLTNSRPYHSTPVPSFGYVGKIPKM